METKTVTISKIARFTTNKTGQPLMTKAGKPYTSVRFQCNEYGERWISGFGNQTNSAWKEGDKVEVIIEQKGEYLNFETPKKEDKVDAKIEQVLNAIVGIRIELAGMNERLNRLVGAKADYPEVSNETAFDEPSDEDVEAEMSSEPQF